MCKKCLPKTGASEPAVQRRIGHVLLRVLCVLLCMAFLSVGFFACISAAVCNRTASRIRTQEELAAADEDFDYIVVLGCRVYEDGTPSPMLRDRVEVGASLWMADICDRILMSGDSHTDYYDEVGTMAKTAVGYGVPEEAILTDAHGLSTYDSIARLAKVWKGSRVVIVTQEYHLYRALYIAEKLGLDAVGVSADLRPYYNQWSRELREMLARCKDVYYSLVQPPHAEEPEQ